MTILKSRLGLVCYNYYLHAHEVVIIEGKLKDLLFFLFFFLYASLMNEADPYTLQPTYLPVFFFLLMYNPYRHQEPCCSWCHTFPLLCQRRLEGVLLLKFYYSAFLFILFAKLYVPKYDTYLYCTRRSNRRSYRTSVYKNYQVDISLLHCIFE